ncbi:MAG: hypothetical protein ABR552_01390, partial [Actinomycetota bacterium]
MRRTIIVSISIACFALTGIAPAIARGPNVNANRNAIYNYAKGAGAGHGKPGANLTWHGGPVQTGTPVHPIYWGASWQSSSFRGDKITGLDTFYRGIGNSSYARTNIEYSGSNGQTSAAVSFVGDAFDYSAAPSRAPSTSAVLSEVAKLYPTPSADNYYPVYVDTKRGSAGYCAWHSEGSIGGVNVEFAFFFNLDGDAGCDPNDTSGLHSSGLAALANVSGHELSEALTD